ncbi:hypothetical protein AWZ03_009798 [Drosophila navojoa]|uniref:Uncharacterized protein n=1 Tax=Drosophila navojoa TaxID=7232 RepID=A0A484B516_DRONA|nr:hypothetical protein AWZ03_009798 [Drosophila navojoa]
MHLRLQQQQQQQWPRRHQQQQQQQAAAVAAAVAAAAAAAQLPHSRLSSSLNASCAHLALGYAKAWPWLWSRRCLW